MPMRRLALLTLLLLMVGGTASAASVSGSGALALAALVAEPSPLLPPGEKAVMARLLNGILTFAFPANRTISVKADKIVCRASNGCNHEGKRRDESQRGAARETSHG